MVKEEREERRRVGEMRGWVCDGEEGKRGEKEGGGDVGGAHLSSSRMASTISLT